MTRGALSRLDLDLLAERVRELAATELLTRFQALEPAGVFEKTGADGRKEPVTIADREMEARLGAVLLETLPGSVLVGEEAASSCPDLLGALDGPDPVWLLDPLDGTAHFARGDGCFGTMLALSVQRELVLSLIHLPLHDETYLAERGSGLWCNGKRLRCSPRQRTPALGRLHSGFAPPALRSRLEALGPPELCLAAGRSCAAVEYTSICTGKTDFVQYYRLLPWDHAPGILCVREAGGIAKLSSAEAYAPSIRQGMLWAACDAATFEQLTRAFRSSA